MACGDLWHLCQQKTIYFSIIQYSSIFHPKTTVSDVIDVYKSNHTSQPTWNIRISYFFINMLANLFADVMLSNIVEVFMHFWTELRGLKRVMERGDITVFRGTFKCDNFYFNYHIEANQVNFSPFSRLEIRTPDVHCSVPPNVHLGTVIYILLNKSVWTRRCLIYNNIKYPCNIYTSNLVCLENTSLTKKCI